MTGKTIQKHKELQGEYLYGCGIAKSDPYSYSRRVVLCGRDDERCHECLAKQTAHKQDLIILREHLEGTLHFLNNDINWHENSIEICDDKIFQLRVDIQELNKMIERYG